MKFTTRSGSVYEVDTNEKRIRRLNGSINDGDWKAYDILLPDPLEVGSSATIMWASDAPLPEDTKHTVAIPTTTTSTIVSIMCAKED